MHILIVDDMPEFKVQQAIQHVKLQQRDITSITVNSVDSVLRYLVKHLDEIDLAIVDLDLPWFDDGRNFDKLNGLVVVAQILRYKPSIPVIINSNIFIPKEKDFLEPYTKKNAVVEHVRSLDGEWLNEFIKRL